ncbi:hypothetical protein EDD16DRAFT_1605893 [Pisolithus croceorrhizus]|nr:hypothetical protein EDD16DRAFT_1605893 [Pisolithus croceorrhizus]KAI6122603.1 hypothetical protein EV401DRAFT_1950947 [Pisolithus croceorrhizus]
MASAAHAVRSDTFAYGANANLTSNLLTSEQRAVIRKSNRKAEQVLGVTLTRDVSAFESLPAESNFGLLMATIGAKRGRSRQPSNVTFVGTLKHFGVKMMGLDKLMTAYGHDKKKQRCTDEKRSYHQRVVLSSRAGSASSLGRRYSSITTSEEDYDDDSKNCLDVDEEYLTTLRRASRVAPLPLPSMRHVIEDDALAKHQSRSPLAPVTGYTSGSFSHGFGHRHSFDVSPKRCSFIPSFRADAAYEACTSDSESFISEAEDFQWDFPDPFNVPTTNPTYTLVMAQYAKMHRGENIAPHMRDDSKFGEHLLFANLPPPPPSPFDYETESVTGRRVRTPVARLSLDAVGGSAQLGTIKRTDIPSRPSSPQDSYDSRVSRGSSTSSDNTCSFALLRADLEYVNAMLRTQETRETKEAIAEEIRRREKRARLRSHLKKIAVLGEEARAVVATAA